MADSVTNFKTNYRNEKMKVDFENSTGLKVNGNEAAYIAFINYLTTEKVYRGMGEIHLLLQELHHKS